MNSQLETTRILVIDDHRARESVIKHSDIVQFVEPAKLMEDSLRLNQESLSGQDFNVVKEFDDVPSIKVDKNKVLKILTDLIQYTKFACDESGHSYKRITLRVQRRDDFVLFSVIDNGVGILEKNLCRIFDYGFAACNNSHGIGLHSIDNAAREFGGRLTVHSDGAGPGASFTLLVPVNPANAEKPAGIRTSFLNEVNKNQEIHLRGR